MRKDLIGGWRSPLAGALVTALLLVAQVAHAGPPPTEANATPSIVVQTPGPTVSGCDVTRVEIWAKDITGLYGIDVRVTFDPTVLQVVDADPNAAGVQITPLGGFLKPDFVVRKIACNTASMTDPNCASAGLAWYAATQTAPSEAVTGSGALAAIDFVGASSGLSSLQIVYSEPVNRDGTLITASTGNAQLTATAPLSPATTIAFVPPTTARLTWPSVSGSPLYRIYRDTAPYFTPAEPPLATTSQLSYDDTPAVGDPSVHHFYTMKTGCASGLLSASGNRVGEFDFHLVRGG